MTRILVIEDHTAVRNLIADILEAAGFHVQVANNGTVGIDLAQKYAPDLVICDIMMPEMDGYAVLRAFKADPNTSTIPFLFLTAKTERADMRKGMELGADDFITKPFAPGELLSAVQAQLQKQAALSEHYETTLRLLRRNIIYALPHELRTPLQVILGHAALLIEERDSLSPEEVAKRALAIQKFGRRLHRLFENYWVYAQIELIATDQEKIQELQNNVCTAAQHIETQARHTAMEMERDPDLDLAIRDPEVSLMLSEESLSKIVEELTRNAFGFSKRGTPVHLSAGRESNSRYLLSVRDQGRGMSADQIAQVGAYMQFERAAQEQQGLGLTIAKRLTELHKGQLEIESAPRQGTLVRVRFPL